MNPLHEDRLAAPPRRPAAGVRRAWALCAALLLVAGLAFAPAYAQDEAPEPPGGAFLAEYDPDEFLDPRFDAPPAPAPEPVPEPEPAPAPEAKEPGIVLNFRDASLDAVLDYLSEAAGFTVLRDTAVSGRVTLTSRQPVTPDEAVDLLSTALKDKGFAVVLFGRNLRVLPLAEAKKAIVPVSAGTDPEAIVPSDRIITHIIGPLRFVDATRLRQDLGGLLPAYAELTANAASNSLILTDTAANIQRIMRIVQALDTQMSTLADVKVFQLRYANATTAARMINEIFSEDRATQQQRGMIARMAVQQRFRGQQQAAGVEEPRQPTRVHASADERTNTVVVTGPPDVLEVVARVVEELDANPQLEQSVFTYRLRNVKSENLANTLNALFREMRNQQAAAAGTTRTRTDVRTRGTTTGTRRTGGRSSMLGPDAQQRSAEYASDAFAPDGQEWNPGDPASRVGPFSQFGQEVSELPPSVREAASEITGEVFVVPDPDTNSIMITSPAGNFARIREILEELDRPVPQVLIKVLIAEVTHTDRRDLGAEFSALNLRASGRGGRIFTDFGVAAQTGGLAVRLVEEDVNVALRALEEAGKLDVLSRPYILASDNQAASITVGQRAPFIRSSRITEAGQTINTIEYEDIGIIFNVTPHINADGLVIMDVEPEISAITGDTVPISETVSAPVFAKRSAQSRVAIQDGQTIVIGGLMEDKKTENVRRVPILGSIPWLGALFRRTVTESTKTELLIFLTPHVAEMASELESMSESEKEAIQAVPGAVREGTFDRHLEGMRRYPSGTPPME